MLVALIILGFALVLSFSFVLLYGAPYLPTRKTQIEQALELLELSDKDHLYELGAGSGGLSIVAASRGARVTAFELNPVLYIVLKIRSRKFKGRLKVRFGNFWKADLGEATCLYVFLLDKYMEKLNQKMQGYPGKRRLVSYTFKIPNKKPTRTLGPMYLYKY